MLQTRVLSITCLLLSLAATSSLVEARPTDQCSPEGTCLDSAFLAYWQKNGGLPVFGFAITAANAELNRDTGRTYLTQWCERNRFEAHPENTEPYRILLGRLGDERLRQQGRSWEDFPKAESSQPHYYPQTGHAIAPEFWEYWRSHGLEFGDPGTTERESLALFGYPLSEPQMETNGSGDTVLTQWFERARFEYHPHNPADYRILLGRLAAEISAASASAPTATPQRATHPTASPVSSIPPRAATATPHRPTHTVDVRPSSIPTTMPVPSDTAVPPPVQLPTVNPTHTALPVPGGS